MNLKNAEVLVTGGSEGIGKEIAARFLAAGSKVIITGRNAEKLYRAKREMPEIITLVNDIGDPLQRKHLAEDVRKLLPGLNILVNNAGIQRRVSLAADHADWAERQAEIDILLSGPIHLNDLLIPLLLANDKDSLIVNVTSGGAYIPQVFAPVYSACKSALHSYTLTLRHALSATRCRVAELIPPAVQTRIAGPGKSHGALLNEFVDQVFPALFINDLEVAGFGPTADVKIDINGQPQITLFLNNVSRFPVELYTK